MAMQYEPPAWAADGRNAFSLALEVIKSGVIVETVALPPKGDQSFAVVGRMEPVCDLVLQHPSISRQHAVLQFDATGALFLRDLRSTHGTFINKKRIDASDYVRVHVGDVLVFGESTRLYAVTGAEELKPAEYESRNLASLRERSERKNEVKKKDQESGASWGFGEDAEEEEGEQESDEEADKKEKLPDYLRNLKDDQRPYQSSIQANDLNEKDQKLFQSLQLRIKKMENLKLEAARITAKQHQLTGLSEGQQQTLARNEQRIQALMAEIEKIEEQIHAKNTQRQTTKSSVSASSSSSQSKPRRSAYDHDSDEDEFYDRTKANQRKLQDRKQQSGGVPTASSSVSTQKKSTGVVLTAESIQRNMKALENSLVEINREFESAQADSVAKSTAADDKEEDALDSFMAATSEQLQASRLAAIHARKVEAETELARQRQLLNIAMPALPSKPVTIAAPLPTPKDHEPSLPKPIESEAPRSSVDVSQSKSPESASADAKTPASKDQAKKTQQVKAHSRPIEAETSKASPSSPRKKPRIVGPSGPPHQSKIGPTMPKTASMSPANELEGGDRVWVPPTNQTGDGRTSLNDKYGY